MANTIGLQIGKVIFNILNDVDITSISGMSVRQIQPAPLKDEDTATVAILYQIDAVIPVNVKRIYRIETAPLYIVDFTLECIANAYNDSITLADTSARLLQEALNGTYNGIKLNGITYKPTSEDYNKARRYYSKRLSFQARILL